MNIMTYLGFKMLSIFKHKGETEFILYKKRIGGVMVSVLAPSAVDCGF
jgi:hypothetical protein